MKPHISILFILFLFTQQTLAENVTQTVMLPSGTISIVENKISKLYFTKRFMYPTPKLEFIVLNNTLDLELPGCRDTIVAGSFQGADEGSHWVTDVVERSGISVKTTSAGQRLFISLHGDESFKSGVFDFVLPAICSTINVSPEPVTFHVVDDKRWTLGWVLSFAVLFSSGVAVLDTFGGSLVALLPTQQFALITMCGCNAEPLQEEGEVLRYALAPVQVSIDGLSKDLSIVVIQFAIVVGIWVIECARGLITHGVRQMKSTRKRKDTRDDNSGEDSDDSEDGNKKFEMSVLQAPYMAIAVHVSFSCGLVFWSVRGLEEDNRFLQALCVVCIITYLLASPIASLALTRKGLLKFYPYQASKGKIPRWLQPVGIWGPNEARLAIGLLLEDFSKRSRMFGSLFLVFRALFAMIYSTTPTTADGCRTLKYLTLVLLAGFIVMLWFVRPLRSLFLNFGMMASQAILFLYVVFDLVWSGVTESPDHWSVFAAVCTGVLFGVWMVVFTSLNMYVVGWEAIGGRGSRHVTNFSTKMKHATMEEMFSDMTERFKEGAIDLRHADIVEHEDDEIGSPSKQAAPAPKKGPTMLADYLLEDYERIPVETREEFSLAAHYHRQQKPKKGLLEPMILHPSSRPVHRNNPHFVSNSKDRAPNVQTLQPSLL